MKRNPRFFLDLYALCAFSRPYFAPVFALAVPLVLGACAQPGQITGGQQDKTPPGVVRTSPKSPAKGMKDTRIVFYFDEYIKAPAAYGKEVFISPLPAKAPKITLLNRKLRVDFRGKLRDSTTYVVTIQGIADNNAGNKMIQPYTAAFSTGATLDSMVVQGSVTNPDGGPAKDITVLLFDEDSAAQDNIAKKLPAYLGKTDDAGKFRLPYLRKAAYRIYGMKDTDSDNRYTAADELLALADTNLVAFGPADTLRTVRLTAFRLDAKAPQIRAAKWTDAYTLAVSFSEPPVLDSLRVLLSDTLGGDARTIDEITVAPTKEGEVLFHTHRDKTRFSQLTLTNLRDSVGNRQDSVLRVPPNRMRALTSVLLVPPQADPSGNLVCWLPAWLDSIPRSRITVTDTAGAAIPDVALRWQDYALTITRPAKMPEGPLRLNVPSGLVPEFAKGKDSTYRFPLVFNDPGKQGKWGGSLVVEGYEGPIVLVVGSGKGGSKGRGDDSGGGATYLAFDREFSFPSITPGKYSVSVVLDTDGNRAWTPGSLHPYRMPERILRAEAIDVKAGWEMGETTLTVGLSATKTRGK